MHALFPRISFKTAGAGALSLTLLLVTLLSPDDAVAADPAEGPTSRPFYMGFTPFHFSWVEDRISETYQMIDDHGDLIAHHFDEGVPWPEALENKPYNEHVEEIFQFRKSEIRQGQKVYVATTPINFERDGLADYWGKKAQEKRPGDWKNRELDDTEVIDAYINYCKRLIEEFNPDYFVYGVEVNLLAANNPEAYDKFKTLAARVYPALKAAYPELPIALSFYLHAPDRMAETKAQVEPLLPYTDLYAISTYPYMGHGVDGYPVDDIPANWFTQTQTIAPGKPFAIAENGYIAEDLKVLHKTMPATAADQRQYMERMLNEAADLDAQFVVWFVVADYDELWGVLKWMVMFNPLIRAWKDTGVFDGEIEPRPALEVWDDWLAKPVSQ